jgi:LmbE family N-acetylglucosaminyl deacetylase
MNVKKWLLLVLTIALLFSYAQSAAAETAEELSGACQLSSTDKSKNIKVLTDASYKTYVTLEADGYIQIELPGGVPCKGLYFTFRDIPARYSVQQQTADGGWEVVATPDTGIVNMFVPLNGLSGVLRIVSSQTNLIAELRVLGEGELPDWVQTWEYLQGKADLMLTVAHPDDEYVFLGGILPYYCGQLHKKAMVVYMTTGWARRRNELLDGLWYCGVRYYPVLCEYYDSYTHRVNKSFTLWGGRELVYHKITSAIRQYRPDVVITQDIKNGEDNHGMHRAVAEATVEAVKLAADSTYDEELLEAFGTWQVQKLYMHLHRENRIVMPWDTLELSKYGYKTAAEAAQEAFEKHVSQIENTHHKVYLTKPYDSRKFGLYFTSVGPDEALNDFFEHIAPVQE